MLNRSASLAMSTNVFKALPGKLDIKRHSPSILYVSGQCCQALSKQPCLTKLNPFIYSENSCAVDERFGYLKYSRSRKYGTTIKH